MYYLISNFGLLLPASPLNCFKIQMAKSLPLRFLILGALLAVVSCNREGDALSAWKANLVDPNNVLTSWDPTLVNPCTWFHITCNNDNSVTRIDLGNAGLSGSLVPQLGQLSNLQYLEVYGNNLTGAIPAELGNLTHLVSLDLFDNFLTGLIPYELGFLSSLKYMRLSNNNLNGPIPSMVGNLTSLIELDLHSNSLSGSIPASLGNLKILALLKLNANNLSGEIPTAVLELVHFGHLRILDVSRNSLARSASHTKSTRVHKLAVTTIIQDAVA